MTEISYLIDLLLNHKLPKVTRENIRARIQLLEKGGATAPRPNGPQASPGAPQATPVPIAASPVAAQALADRQAMMNAAGNGQAPSSVFKKH